MFFGILVLFWKLNIIVIKKIVFFENFFLVFCVEFSGLIILGNCFIFEIYFSCKKNF